ncbi:MAG: hypothetical protein Ct9H90mP16_12880 [Candidatus Poseidoniales archaeon]|nr:MAG: hypothetical protein Ct9H90mP16_12880 [Candidatus Poseidoniales archaeon]
MPCLDELTFWVEGDDERARCYYPRCGAWIEQNAYDPTRWDCGWPAANWNKRAEDYKQAYQGLVSMRGSAASAGTSVKMPTREEWLSKQETERETIHQKNSIHSRTKWKSDSLGWISAIIASMFGAGEVVEEILEEE